MQAFLLILTPNSCDIAAAISLKLNASSAHSMRNSVIVVSLHGDGLHSVIWV